MRERFHRDSGGRFFTMRDNYMYLRVGRHFNDWETFSCHQIFPLLRWRFFKGG